MMKYYLLGFGTGNPATYSGLSPTFTFFGQMPGGTLVTSPLISSVPGATGLYQFSYGPTGPVAFIVDGGASLSDTNRYLVGILDPVQAVDQQIGTSTDSYGDSSTDPSTIFGEVKRLQENLEGNATFNKATGQWIIASRDDTQLATKTLVNDAGSVTKT